MSELRRLIREARARLDSAPISDEDREQRRRNEILDRFALWIKQRIDAETWPELFPLKQVWHQDGPALEVVADRFTRNEKTFLMRPIEGGIELISPTGAVPIADDKQFNDKLLTSIGDALDKVDAKSANAKP